MRSDDDNTEVTVCEIAGRTNAHGVKLRHATPKVAESVRESVRCAIYGSMTPSVSSDVFPNVAFERGRVVRLIVSDMDLSRPFKEDRRALPLCTPLSSKRPMV